MMYSSFGQNGTIPAQSLDPNKTIAEDGGSLNIGIRLLYLY
jgi:hypothetical protein